MKPSNFAAYLLVLVVLAGVSTGDLHAQQADALAFDKATVLWTIPWDADWVTAAHFIGNSSRLAVGNKLGQILLFDLPEKAETYPPPVRRLDGHTNMITGLASTPDGHWLISSSYDHTLRLWDLQSAAKSKELVVLKGTGKKAKGKADEFTVEVQDAGLVLSTHSDWVRSMSLSQDGKRLLSGDDKGLAIVWDIPAGKELTRWQTQGWLPAVALSPDGQHAVTCAFGPRYSNLPNAIRLWDVKAAKELADLGASIKTKGSEGTINSVAAAFSRDGKVVALGKGGETDQGKIYLMDVAKNKKLHELNGHLYGTTALAFHPDGQHLASAGRDTTVRIWRVSDGKQVAELGKRRGGQFNDWIHSVAFTADGRRLAATDMAGQVQIWAFDKK